MALNVRNLTHPSASRERDAVWEFIYMDLTIKYGAVTSREQLLWDANYILWSRYDRWYGVPRPCDISPGTCTKNAWSQIVRDNPSWLYIPSTPLPTTDIPDPPFGDVTDPSVSQELPSFHRPLFRHNSTTHQAPLQRPQQHWTNSWRGSGRYLGSSMPSVPSACRPSVAMSPLQREYFRLQFPRVMPTNASNHPGYIRIMAMSEEELKMGILRLRSLGQTLQTSMQSTQVHNSASPSSPHSSIPEPQQTRHMGPTNEKRRDVLKHEPDTKARDCRHSLEEMLSEAKQNEQKSHGGQVDEQSSADSNIAAPVKQDQRAETLVLVSTTVSSEVEASIPEPHGGDDTTTPKTLNAIENTIDLTPLIVLPIQPKSRPVPNPEIDNITSNPDISPNLIAASCDAGAATVEAHQPKDSHMGTKSRKVE